MIIEVRPLVGKKNVKRGHKMVSIESKTCVDEVLEDGYRVALCYREKNANLIVMAEIAEATQAAILEALAKRDRMLEPVDFKAYDMRHVVRQPQIGDDDGTS